MSDLDSSPGSGREVTFYEGTSPLLREAAPSNIVFQRGKASERQRNPKEFMLQVEIFEQPTAELDEASLSKHRDGFMEFDQTRWEQKLEADSNAGKLEFLIHAALAEHEAGLPRDRCKKYRFQLLCLE